MIINTIAKFLALTEPQQSDILRGIRHKERLESFLENRGSKEVKEAHTVTCKHCEGKGTIVIEPRNNDDIHASQIHSCPRKIWFDLKKYGNTYRQKVSSDLQMIFDHGTKLHDMLQEYGMQGAWKTDPFTTYEPEFRLLPDEEECLKKGVPFFPLVKKYKVRSSVDAVIRGYRVDEVRDIGTVYIDLIQEIKSISASGLAYLDGPKAVHKKQATLYQGLLDIPVCVFIYYGKDDKRHFYPQRFDGYIWGELEDKINEILFMEDQENPNLAVPIEKTAWTYDREECIGGKYTSACQYYQKVCFPGIVAEPFIPVTEVKKRGRPRKITGNM